MIRRPLYRKIGPGLYLGREEPMPSEPVASAKFSIGDREFAVHNLTIELQHDHKFASAPGYRLFSIDDGPFHFFKEPPPVAGDHPVKAECGEAIALFWRRGLITFSAPLENVCGLCLLRVVKALEVETRDAVQTREEPMPPIDRLSRMPKLTPDEQIAERAFHDVIMTAEKHRDALLERASDREESAGGQMSQADGYRDTVNAEPGGAQYPTIDQVVGFLDDVGKFPGSVVV
jgi:hypothetical protein